MKTLYPIMIVLALIVRGGPAQAQNMIMDFPQIAVGDQYVTIIDLWHKGSETFVGDLHIYDDQASFLPVRINGTPVSAAYKLSIPAGTVLRLQITSTGETKAGHAIIFDRLTESNINLDQQITGTLVFQFVDGSYLLDSVGVIPGPLTEHFHFLCEYTDNILTGFALSDPARDAKGHFRHRATYRYRDGGAGTHIASISTQNQFVVGYTRFTDPSLSEILIW
ncbi:MAG: hypothetical protein JRJ87_27605 [Deltaproteobacteria bacterium]|nr:hypothetical protein [Deltaproteobacteria bacterium]